MKDIDWFLRFLPTYNGITTEDPVSLQDVYYLTGLIPDLI